jgi:hypothetical protein
MMTTQKTNWKWLAALPVAALTLGLGGCGGGGDDDGPEGGEQTAASISACFTVDRTVNFAVESFNVPAGSVGINRSTAGPMTFNGQAVTGQTFFYPTGATPVTETNYWKVANNGVTFVGKIDTNGNIVSGNLFYPENMIPNQTATDSSNGNINAFIGFKTVNLPNKTFFNVCHFQATNAQGNGVAEAWYAPKYGLIRQTLSNGIIIEYNRDL